MIKLKKSAKTIWKYRWEVFVILTTVANIATTIEQIIDKKYELAFAQGAFTCAFIVVLLQSKVISDQGKLINSKDEIIDLQDELIDIIKKSEEENDSRRSEGRI